MCMPCLCVCEHVCMCVCVNVCVGHCVCMGVGLWRFVCVFLAYAAVPTCVTVYHVTNNISYVCQHILMLCVIVYCHI